MARFAYVRKFCIYAKFAYICKSGHVYTALVNFNWFLSHFNWVNTQIRSLIRVLIVAPKIFFNLMYEIRNNLDKL